jgi:transcriptional regulator of arginine metabolism
MRGEHTAARRRLLREILNRQRIEKQGELVTILDRAGYRATQATISRDLAAIGAQKVLMSDGRERYVEGTGEVSAMRRQPMLVSVLQSYLVSLAPSGNLLVVRTLPAGAGPVAAVLDGAGLTGVLGTVAGDDTVLVITKRKDGASALRRRLEEMLR